MTDVHELELTVNGVPRTPACAGPPAALRLPAARSRPHRYPCRLRARRLRSLHRAARRSTGALLPAVRGQRRRIVGHDCRGLLRAGRVARPGPAGVLGLPRVAMRLLHAGVRHHDHRISRENPEPTAEQAREAIARKPVPLHGVPEHRRLGTAGRRDPAREDAGDERPARSASRSPAREDLRLLSGQGRYLDDIGHTALAAAFVRSPHAHARIVDIDVTDALDVEGWWRSTPTRTCTAGWRSRCRC